MNLPEPIDLSIERLVHLDQRVDANESDALRARWEFGQQMRAERERNGGEMPWGFVPALVARTGKSRRELDYRRQFADAYPTEEDLCNALQRFTAWRDLVASLKQQADAEANTIGVPKPAPEGTFGTIVADPPWRYGNTSTRGAAENHYPTMSIEELCKLDVARDRAAPQSHLYLWSTAGHLPDAFKVMEAWGFEYKTYFVWVKPQMGMGNYFRVSTELALFGTRGGIRTTQRDIKNYLHAPRAKHSAKPLAFQDVVARTSPGPYLEMFARCRAEQLLHGCECSKCRLGWTTWGNQS